jgi:hypothetical protein
MKRAAVGFGAGVAACLAVEFAVWRRAVRRIAERLLA